MTFNWEMPVNIFFGDGSLNKNKHIFKELGKKAFIVSGKTSAIKSGCFDDIKVILEEYEIEYELFLDVLNNPTLENTQDGGNKARIFGADYIIAIGGGSPLDAAKAIAVYAKNEDIILDDIYTKEFKNGALPIVAIPTTSGTGSEVTPYSILTHHKIENKKSFSSPLVYPKYAFLEPRYTKSAPKQILIDTVVDAFSHSLEGYLSNRATPITDALAEEAFKIYAKELKRIAFESQFDYEQLMYASLLGGMVIAQTGTMIVHSIGYGLTYFKDVPHGRANGILIAEFLRLLNNKGVGKVSNVLELLDVKSINELNGILKILCPIEFSMSDEEIIKSAEISIKAANVSFMPIEVTLNNEIDIIKKSIKDKI